MAFCLPWFFVLSAFHYVSSTESRPGERFGMIKKGKSRIWDRHGERGKYQIDAQPEILTYLYLPEDVVEALAHLVCSCFMIRKDTDP